MHSTQLPTLGALTAALLFAGCQSNEITPHWVDDPIEIDGDPADWGDLIFTVEDADYDFGYANDDEYLYLCVITEGDLMRRQAIAGGVHVWFDPDGGDERVVGVRYPIGVGGTMAAQGGGSSQPQDREAVQAMFEETAANSLGQVALLSGGGAVTEVSLTELEGLKVNSLLTSTSLVLEMRVPLHSFEGADLALGVNPTATSIGLELYVPELRAPARPADRPGGESRGGGGMRGGGGGRGGGQGGGRGGGPPPGASGADAIQERIEIPLALPNSLELSSSR